EGIGSDAWQTVALDAMGRLKLTGSAPGLIEIEVTAVDADGFRKSQTQTVRVRDPQDTAAPVLSWQGALQGATPQGMPVTLASLTTLSAAVKDLQLMGYELEIARANSGEWLSLGSQSWASESIDGVLNLGSLDPAKLANGVYTLRLRAWDLSGRTAEIETRIIVDSETKALGTVTATDAVFALGDHQLALTRSITTGLGASQD